MNIEEIKAKVAYDRDFGYWKTLSEDEKELRRMLFWAHGSMGHGLYGDDGERQCNTCWCDFKRDTVAELRTKMDQYHMKQAIKAGIVKLEETGKKPQHDHCSHCGKTKKQGHSPGCTRV